MKKYILLLTLTIIATSCNAQKNKLMTPEIDSRFEKFDSIRFSLANKENPYVLRDFLNNKTFIEMDQGDYGKGYKESPPNSYFRITKIYYPNGVIKKKGISVNTGTFQKGIWYEFDEEGKLIKEIDYDKPFKFTFEDVLQFCEKQNIKIEKGPILQGTGWHNLISREIENGKPVWSIEYLKKRDLIEIIKLDGVTGKILGTETYGYINN